MFWGSLVSRTAMTARLILLRLWPTCDSDSESATPRTRCGLALQKIINSRYSLQRQQSILLHSVTRFSEASDPILQVDWKLKPRDQDWIRRLLIMSPFYHLHRSQMVFLQAQFDLYLEEKSLWISCFFSLLISRDTAVIPWVLLDMFHYGTISSYYGGKKSGMCLCFNPAFV